MKHLFLLSFIGIVFFSCSSKKVGVLSEVALIADKQLFEIKLLNKSIAEAEKNYDIINWSKQTRALKDFQKEANQQLKESLRKNSKKIPFEQLGVKDHFQVQSIQLIDIQLNDTIVTATFCAFVTLKKDSIFHQKWNFLDYQNQLLSQEIFNSDTSKLNKFLINNKLYAQTSNFNSIYQVSKIQIP